MGWVSVSNGSLLTPCRCQWPKREAIFIEGHVGKERAHLYTFEKFQEIAEKYNRPMLPALVSACAWANGTGQPWVVLVGNPGCGKTMLSLVAGRCLAGSGRQVAFYTSPALIDALRAEIRDNIAREKQGRAEFTYRFDYIKGAEHLIIDDLGMERGTEFAVERLETILVERSEKRLKTFITANTLERISDRVASRFTDKTLCAFPDISRAVDMRPLLKVVR